MDDRDDWLEGVRRWYFGGTPGPDDLMAVPGLLGDAPAPAEDDTLAMVPRRPVAVASQACTPS